MYDPTAIVGGVAPLPDLLRLLAVPTFGWAAYRDLRCRRVANRTWLPLVAVGLLALTLDASAVLDAPAFVRRLFVVRVAVSLGVVAPLGYLFWRLGGFGGADAKALMVLALVFPTFPAYYLPWGTFPSIPGRLGVLSLSVLTNTVLIGLAFPLALAARNALEGRFSPAMFVGKPVDSEAVEGEYGRLLDAGSEPGPRLSRGGLDLDALRMYLRWRDVSLAALRDAPEAFRDPASIGATRDPGDGVVDENRRARDGARRSGPSAPAPEGDGAPSRPAIRRTAYSDPWGAAAFLAAVDGDAYGTTTDELRAGLDALARRDAVWLTPGLPFVVPLFVGLLLALVVGDLLFAALSAMGFA